MELSWCSYSPTELLMGRKVKTVPQTASHLTPKWYFFPDFNRRIDRHHHARQADLLPLYFAVWVSTS